MKKKICFWIGFIFIACMHLSLVYGQRYPVVEYFNYDDGDMPSNWIGIYGYMGNITDGVLMLPHIYPDVDPIAEVYGNDTFFSLTNWEMTWRVRHDGVNAPANTSWSKKIDFYWAPSINGYGIDLTIGHEYVQGVQDRYWAKISDLSAGTMSKTDNTVPELEPLFGDTKNGSGTWHTILIRRTMISETVAQYACYIDGSLFIYDNDEDLVITSGYVGLELQTYQTASFDNLMVEDLDYATVTISSDLQAAAAFMISMFFMVFTVHMVYLWSNQRTENIVDVLIGYVVAAIVIAALATVILGIGG